MTWIMRVPGGEVSSDDFTLDELELVEKQTGTPWSISNPLRSVAVARAFLKVAVVKSGGSPQDVDKYTLRELKNRFDFRADDDDDEATGEGVDAPPPLARTSRESSSGAASAIAGHRKRRAANE